MVVDANVVIQAIFDPRGPHAEAIGGATHPMAPPLMELEAAETIRHRFLNGVLSRPTADVAIERLRALPIERRDEPGLLPRIWKLCANLTACDAAYVALAEHLGTELLTADARLASAPGLRCQVRLVRR